MVQATKEAFISSISHAVQREGTTAARLKAMQAETLLVVNSIFQKVSFALISFHLFQ